MVHPDIRNLQMSNIGQVSCRWEQWQIIWGEGPTPVAHDIFSGTIFEMTTLFLHAAEMLCMYTLSEGFLHVLFN